MKAAEQITWMETQTRVAVGRMGALRPYALSESVVDLENIERELKDALALARSLLREAAGAPAVEAVLDEVRFDAPWAVLRLELTDQDRVKVYDAVVGELNSVRYAGEPEKARAHFEKAARAFEAQGYKRAGAEVR